MSESTDQPPLPDSSWALFLDFDGTLAPIQDDPDSVALPPGLSGVLERLSARLGGALAIISGRDIEDLCGRVPAGLWRLGNHGLNVLEPGQGPAGRQDRAPDMLVRSLQALSAAHPGTMIETKGSVIALHYRAVPDLKEALEKKSREIVDSIEGYRLQSGKMVLEAKPDGASKGLAIAAIMERAPFAGRLPVMAGDDVTDEDGFETVLKLGGMAVKIGEGPTQAGYRLSSPAAVQQWLERGIG